MPKIHGLLVDQQTRCQHYHQKEDVVAIKFKCCQKYYPCYQCHEVCEEHSMKQWDRDDVEQVAVFCGMCKTEMTINAYLSSSQCPYCQASFNPGCAKHYNKYFTTSQT